MRSINLYFLTRLQDKRLYSYFESALSRRETRTRIHIEEIDEIKILVGNLRLKEKSWDILDNWFYSFSIPQIGKEFDLLKIAENGAVINIEIKSQKVEKEKLENQLKQNRYYLSHLGGEIYSFAYVREDDANIMIYAYDEKLRDSSFDEIIKRLLEFKEPITDNIERYFRPKEFLVSPLNTPEKFLDGQYYLSLQQEEIKKQIVNANSGLWGITGAAGTGKTLLLYDVAKELSYDKKVCVIHSGILSEGHKYINAQLQNVSVIAAKSVSKEMLETYSVVCVDETQRLYAAELDAIIEVYKLGKIEQCVFAYDYAQTLSRAERNRNNPKRLNEIIGFEECKLTDRIRTNKEIYSFIRNMMKLNDKSKIKMSYDNIDILYARTIQEADIISDQYIGRGYTFITFTPSQYVWNLIDHYAENINSHEVIGQEFDNVVVILDNSFRYSEEGILQAKEHPNPNYLFERLFYQNITRAREKLCIIVLDNIELFEKLLCVKGQWDIE